MFHYFIFLELLHHMCLLYHMPLTISKCFLTCFKIIFRLSAIHIFEWFPPFKELWNIYISGIFKMCYCFKHYILTCVFLTTLWATFCLSFHFFLHFKMWHHFEHFISFFTSFCSTFFSLSYFIHFEICPPSLWGKQLPQGVSFSIYHFSQMALFQLLFICFQSLSFSNVPFSF